MTGGETAEDGDSFRHIGTDHVLYAVEIQIRLAAGELAEDDASASLEYTVENQGIDKTVDVAHVLFHLFDEQDDVPAQGGVGLRTQDGREGAEIAADQDAGRVSGPVLGMGRNLVGRNLPQQEIAEERAGRVVSPGLGQVGSHGSVDAHGAGARFHFQQGGDVTVADEPFRMSRQLLHRQQVHQPDGPIAAPVAQDGLDGRIPESPFEVRDAFFRLAGILSPVHFPDMGADDRFETPAAQHCGRCLHILHRGIVRGRQEGDFVPGFEEGWLGTG